MTIYSAAAINRRKTFFIIFLFIVFFLTVSYILGKASTGYGIEITGFMFVISGIISFFSYYYSDKIVLSMSRAHIVDPKNYRELHNTMQNLTIATGLPMPKLYLIEDLAPNAFATGRDPKHAAVAVTAGLLQKLTSAELEGVLAHELSHVKNYDTRLMGVMSVLVGTIAIAADIFLRTRLFGDRKSSGPFLILAIAVSILAPIAATLMQLALSRKRELFLGLPIFENFCSRF